MDIAPSANLLEKFMHSSTTVSKTPAKPPPVVKVLSEKKMQDKKEERYPWLVRVKDAEMRDMEHADYDPRTLHIPSNAWKLFTPFERQFWEIKCKHFDTVVFFKKGKFYELYENDADIGHQQFDLKLTERVNMRMVGVPEASFDFWVAKFIAKGHKVARVDQMETAIGKSMREKTEKTKEDKIIKRELTCILTAGTLTNSSMLMGEQATYCLSIKVTNHHYGVCFVDAATGQFYCTSFQDDENNSLLETLLVQIRPREVVYEKGNVDKRLLKMIKNNVDNVLLYTVIDDVMGVAMPWIPPPSFGTHHQRFTNSSPAPTLAARNKLHFPPHCRWCWWTMT
jgi:DNA mismatch repair protein MSH6